MRFAIVGDEGGAALRPLAERIGALMTAAGHERLEQAGQGVELVFNLTSPASPRANYLRSDPSVFVATLVESGGEDWPGLEEFRRATYPVLVKTMSNVVVHRVAGGALGGSAYFMTPELGFRRVPDDDDLPRAVADYVTPLAGARMVIANRLDEDLPEELWEGDDRSRELAEYGRRLAAMNLLPSVFDINSVLDERDLRMAMKLFGLKQLSYGNLSVRRDASSFWMSGRGVDKGNLRAIGRDIFLVKGYDPDSQTLLLSVPPGADPTSRVSVDAIEHYKIYRHVPEVGAIVHVHAWMEGVEATLQSWPCGTEQLADEVLSLVLAAPDPSRAVVGLKNHGLTITGHSLPEIFGRIEGRLVQEIPALE